MECLQVNIKYLCIIYMQCIAFEMPNTYSVYIIYCMCCYYRLLRIYMLNCVPLGTLIAGG